MRLADFISDAEIIAHLCKQRIKRAKAVHDRQFVARLKGKDLLEGFPDQICQILPPRRQWALFRPMKGHGSADVDLVSLRSATVSLRQSQPQAPWAIGLANFIHQVRGRILSGDPFQFGQPKIRPVLKEGNKYRALCRFGMEDNLVICLVANYLRDFCDPAFEKSSFAFRAQPSHGPMPTHHQAFDQIHRLKSEIPAQDLIVAECDIRGFYDTVAHSVALDALNKVATQVQAILPERQLDLRAVEIFRAYLDCYSFPRNVLEQGGQELKYEDPKGYFPWPADELADFHSDPGTERIGVPQGGAISCVIANLVLDLADKRIEDLRCQVKDRLHYFRYCDDMILLAENRKDCSTAFDAYLAALRDLKLPYHKPKKVWIYDKGFWAFKSKAPYRWTGKKWFGCVPWVQFGGYQVRYDGLVRIRKSSVEKHRAKLMEITDEAKFGLLEANKPGRIPKRKDPPKIPADREQVMASFLQRLTSTGVGRINPGQHSDGPMPLCWANGYKALHGKPLIPAFLKRLDRERERQIRRLHRAKIVYGPGRAPRNGGRRKRPAPFGHLFSYAAQFHDAGGAQLIRNPYRPKSWWEKCQEWIFGLVKGGLTRVKSRHSANHIVRK